MKFEIVKLFFTTPIHLGTDREDYTRSDEFICSDTLYSAIISAWDIASMEVGDIHNPEFVLSSAFPFYQKDKNSEAIYFFPKPFIHPAKKDDSTYADRKKLKKIKWMDKPTFEKLINRDENFLFNESNIYDKYFYSEIPPEKFISVEELPKVRAARLPQEDSEPYYLQRIFFKEYCGLYFILICDNEKVRRKINSALEILSNEGIGSYRTIGQGLFDSKTTETEISLPQNANHFCNLSLFCPQNKEQLKPMLNAKSSYELIRRGGWITKHGYRTYRRQHLYMFQEGSIFNDTKESNQLQTINHILSGGKIADVTPDILYDNPHPFYRFGKAMFLPVKIQ